MIKFLRTVLLPLAVIALFFACESADEKDMTPDQKQIHRGVNAWNSKGPEAARPFWKDIKDPKAKDQYLSYIDRQAELVKNLEEVSAIKPDADTKLAPAYEKMLKTYSVVPPELKLEEGLRKRVTDIAADSVRERIKDGRIPSAQELNKQSITQFGETPDLKLLATELDVMMASRKKESEAENVIKSARDEEDFQAKIKKYEDAIASYQKAEASFAENSKSQNVSNAPEVVSYQSKLKKKRQDTKIEMDRRLRERLYSFKDRIGEEFARVPEGDQLGHMTLDDILKFQQDIRNNVEADSKELSDFAVQFPAVIDKNMLKEVDEQKKALNDKIAEVEQEIKTAKDIASRGTPILPLLIGLFNAQPGGTAKDQKSRPGVFRGPTHNTPDYWWGMVSIPANTYNDLVISVNDNRQIHVYADNTKSGSLVSKDSGKTGLTDLVNRSYKVGNVWPVLNAGKQLKTGKYYIEIQPGKNPSFAGDAVIYSSFVMRAR